MGAVNPNEGSLEDPRAHVGRHRRGVPARQRATRPVNLERAIVETGSSTITVYTDGIVAFAAEDYNNTSGSNGRLRVEVA